MLGMPHTFSSRKIVGKRWSKRVACCAIGLLASAATTPAQAIVPSVEYPVAVLRALDKITARVEELSVPIGRPINFGTLSISVRTCRATPPEDTPESAAYIEVVEIHPGANDTSVFRGWMFASSPSLSAMEHPIYDLWVTGCKGTPLPSTMPEEPLQPPEQIAPPPPGEASPQAAPAAQIPAAKDSAPPAVSPAR